jgi:hypothetical protein
MVKCIPYVSTLEQLHEQITEGIFPFVTFRVQIGPDIISNVTIPHCRFRPTESDEIIEARSCDCGGSICGVPTQSLYLSKNQMKNYVFIEKQSLSYVFLYQIPSEDGADSVWQKNQMSN